MNGKKKQIEKYQVPVKTHILERLEPLFTPLSVSAGPILIT